MESLTYGLLIATAFFAGILDASVGGGGFVLIPALAFAGSGIAAAIGTSRIVFFLDSGSAAIGHARKSNVNYKVALIYSAFAVVGARLGAYATAHLPAAVTSKAFGFFMLAMLGVIMRRPRLGLNDSQAKKHPYVGLPAGFFIGIMIGLFGGGAGILIIISLIMFSGMRILRASGTSQLIVWITNASAMIAYYENGLVDVRLGVILGLVALAGALAGVEAAHKVGDAWLRRALFAVTLVSALKLLIL